MVRALRYGLVWCCILLVAMALQAPALSQDPGGTPDDPFIFFTPGLAIIDRDTDHDRFFNSIDTTLVLPFSPNINAQTTFSLQFRDSPRWTATANYDWFSSRDTTIRASGGWFSNDFGARLTAFQQRRRWGTGVRAGVMGGDFEIGGFVTLPFAWGFPLRKQSTKDRIHGRNRVTDLGASTAVSISLRGDRPDLGTEPEYFYPRDSDWHRAGQGAQGTSSTTAGLGANLHQVWMAHTGEAVRSSAAIVDNTVYVGSDDGYVYALALDTGELRWKYWLGAPVVSSPAAEGGRVFVGCDDGSLYCLRGTVDGRLTDEQVGEQIWRFRTGGEVAASPLVTVSGLVLFGSKDGNLYAVNSRTAKLAWLHQTGGPVTASPTKSERPIPVAVPGASRTEKRDIVFCGSEDGILYAIAEKDGAPLWRVNTGSPIVGMPAVLDSRVYVANRAGQVIALEGGSGREIWRQSAGGLVRASLSVSDQRLIVPTLTGRILGLNAATGEPEWVADLPAEIESTPVSAQAKTLFVGCSDGKLYGIDRRTGEVKWQSGTSGPVTASPAIAHGRLVCGSHDGTVYAFSDRARHDEVYEHTVSSRRAASLTPPTPPVAGPGATQIGPRPPGTNLPPVAPRRPAWQPPPGWLKDAPSTTVDEPTANTGPGPTSVPVPPRASTGGVQMQLVSEPADAAELPIHLTGDADTVVSWGTTEPEAEVDGVMVRNQGGRIEARKSFDGDGTYPVTMITGKGTRDERIACRLVIVNTAANPESARAVAFSPDGDGIGDTIAFRALAKGGLVSARAIEIRDASGKTIRKWVAPGPGESTFIWDGKDIAGKPVPAGTYMVVYEAKDDSRPLKSMKQSVLLQRAGERMAAD